MLKHDLENAEIDAKRFPVYEKLNQVRKDVLIEMVFNLGYSRLSGFKKMFAALERKDYDEAANQMLDSKWAIDVGERARTLAYFMRIG
jgi:lysozyme